MFGYPPRQRPNSKAGIGRLSHGRSPREIEDVEDTTAPSVRFFTAL